MNEDITRRALFGRAAGLAAMAAVSVSDCRRRSQTRSGTAAPAAPPSWCRPSHEDFKANRRKAFHGLALAMVQSTAKTGQIRVSAASPGLEGAAVLIATKA